MTITEKMYLYNDILLDNRALSDTICQQPTANSQQPTANSQQPTSNFYSNNFIFRYIYFANKSSLGIRSVFSLHSVAALFLCLGGSSSC